jgi:ketosteroid isomerase-like protein
MPTELLRDLVYRSYEAYDRGNRNFALDLFDDNIEWIFHVPPEALPIPPRVRGKAAVLAALGKIDALVEVIKNDIELVLVDGDNAIVICDRTLRQRATGRVIRYKFAALHRYQGGRLVQYQMFADGLDMLQQALGRSLDLPSAYET